MQNRDWVSLPSGPLAQILSGVKAPLLERLVCTHFRASADLAPHLGLSLLYNDAEPEDEALPEDELKRQLLIVELHKVDTDLQRLLAKRGAALTSLSLRIEDAGTAGHMWRPCLKVNHIPNQVKHLATELRKLPAIMQLSLVGTNTYQAPEHGDPMPNAVAEHTLNQFTGLQRLSLQVEQLFFGSDRLKRLAPSLQLIHTLDITNTIPDLDFVKLLPSLRQLSVHDVETISQGAFSSMSSVIALCARVRRGVFFEGIENLTSLRTLQLIANSLTSFRFLGQLTQLERLQLDLSVAENIARLSTLQKLTSFDVAGMRLRRIGAILEMTALTQLTVKMNSRHEVAVVVPNDSSLRQLSVLGGKLTSEDLNAISRASSINSLCLNDCEGLDGENMLVLSSLTSLTSLCLRNTDADQNSVRILRSDLPCGRSQLRILDVRDSDPHNEDSHGILPPDRMYRQPSTFVNV